MAFDSFQAGPEQRHPGYGLARLDEKRGGPVRNVGRKRSLPHIDIDADTHNHEVYGIHLRVDLRQNAHRLFPADQNVVRPLDPAVKRRQSFNRLRYGHRHHEGQARRFRRPDLRLQDHCEVEARPGRRKPFPASPSPPPALRFGNDQHPFRRPVGGQNLGVSIRRCGLFQADDLPLPQDGRRQPLPDFRLDQEVEGLLEAIPLLSGGLDDVPLLPELADMLPDRGPADRQLIGQDLAGYPIPGLETRQ
ncbi:MAG: hypothetical protein CSYNP_04497 [Syntrophus sp. SKADARSKE-3]|nr:hypothetical protein [Syntrophus sp. SKADARSKE-3]